MVGEGDTSVPSIFNLIELATTVVMSPLVMLAAYGGITVAGKPVVPSKGKTEAETTCGPAGKTVAGDWANLMSSTAILNWLAPRMGLSVPPVRKSLSFKGCPGAPV